MSAIWLALQRGDVVEAVKVLLAGTRRRTANVTGGVLAWRWARTPCARREVLSPAGYWRSDGSMRCPREDVEGANACEYHAYSGCSDDGEWARDPANRQRAPMRVEAAATLERP